MEVKFRDKRCVTPTLKFVKLLVPPTLSAPRKEDLISSPEVPTAKPMVLATLVSLPLIVDLRTVVYLPIKLLAT